MWSAQDGGLGKAAIVQLVECAGSLPFLEARSFMRFSWGGGSSPIWHPHWACCPSTEGEQPLPSLVMVFHSGVHGKIGVPQNSFTILTGSKCAIQWH